MTKIFQYTFIFTSLLVFSCKNDVLKKNNSKKLHLAIIHDGDSIVPFWKSFQESESIEVIPHYFTLEQFLQNVDSLNYNFNADVIWLPSVYSVQALLKENILQPLPHINSEKAKGISDESKRWFVIGYDPFIVTTEKPVTSYSDLKADGKWISKLNQQQENHFYSFAKIHFNSIEKFEKWKEEMERNKLEGKNIDSVFSSNKKLSLLSIERKNGNLSINKQGISLFYDIAAIGVYKHCKNYTSATLFVNWIITDNQLAQIADNNKFVSPRLNKTNQHLNFHRIRPDYLIQHAK